jgi:hypothetical protein
VPTDKRGSRWIPAPSSSRRYQAPVVANGRLRLGGAAEPRRSRVRGGLYVPSLAAGHPGPARSRGSMRMRTTSTSGRRARNTWVISTPLVERVNLFLRRISRGTAFGMSSSLRAGDIAVRSERRCRPTSYGGRLRRQIAVRPAGLPERIGHGGERFGTAGEPVLAEGHPGVGDQLLGGARTIRCTWRLRWLASVQLKITLKTLQQGGRQVGRVNWPVTGALTLSAMSQSWTSQRLR